MSNQPKTPGAMVLVPREAFRWAVEQLEEDGNKGTGYFETLSRCAEQTPAVGGDVPRYWVHWNDQLYVRTPEMDEGTVCKWPDVSPLLVKLEAVKFNLAKTDRLYLAAVAEIERLKNEVGQVKGEYDRAVNRVDALRAELGAQQGDPVKSTGHAIPQWLREQFSAIEDEAVRMGGGGVFTQMRTKVQAYFEMLRGPSATAKVVLPERMSVPDADCPERVNAQGWNSCLDKIAKLNP